MNRTVGGNALIEGSVVSGAVVNPLTTGGKVTLQAAIDTRHVEDSVFTSSALWQSTTSSGSIAQTLHMPEIHGTIPAGLSAYQGAGGVSVQLPAGASVRTTIEALAKEPGKEYLATMANRSDVDWQRVQVLNQSLDFSQSGLTKEAAIIVAVVVTILSYGTASGWGAAAASATNSAAVGAAVTAGTTSLASTAAVSLINNHGDIGAVLNELGSSDNLNGLLLTMATAGLSQGVLGSVPVSGGAPGATLASVNAASPWNQLLGKNIVQGLSSAVMESAVLGTSLEDAIKNNLQSALINIGAALGANAIGDAAKGVKGINETSKAIAHALLGCAIGTATSGNGAGCAPGATGAVVGELVAGWYADTTGYDQLKIDASKPGASEAIKQQFAVASNTMAELAKLAGAGGTLLVGGDAAAMQLAMNTANNAAVNNRQLHAARIKLIQNMSADPQKQAQLAAVLCVMQNCQIDGLNGYDANGKALFDEGKLLGSTDPEQFNRLKTEIQGSGLLSGQFAYQPGGLDFTKDALGSNINDKLISIKQGYQLATSNPEDWASAAAGAIKGLANNVKDAPQYDIANDDERRGAIWANTLLVVGPAAVVGVEGTINAMGRTWEAGKVLGAGEISMSTGGNISAQQVTRAGTPAALSQTDMGQLNTLNSLDNAAAGALREGVADTYFQRNGF